nr:non-N-glycosylated interleukin-3 [synthetic construct]
MPTTTLQPKNYLAMIQEITRSLEALTVTSAKSLTLNELETLVANTLLRPNLEAFVTFAENHLKAISGIKKNLEKFRPILPTSMSTEEPISIEEGDLGDFRAKLMEYLVVLRDSLKPMITEPHHHHHH